MSEFGSYRELLDSGYEAIRGIKADESLSPDEKAVLIEIDPTIEQVRNVIADIFAEEDAEAKRFRDSSDDDRSHN